MERMSDGQNILQRIDKMMEELQLLRREVADRLVRDADRRETAAQPAEQPHENATSHISCVSSLEELYALDFAKAKNEKEPNNEESEKPISASTESVTVDKEFFDPDEAVENQQLDELFIPRDSEEILEDAFERKLRFDLIDQLTIADRYLFANELFYGDQEALVDMLRDIERLSSWSHLESYLYEVRQYSKEDEAVKQLVAYIKEHAH